MRRADYSGQGIVGYGIAAEMAHIAPGLDGAVDPLALLLGEGVNGWWQLGLGGHVGHIATLP